MSYIRNKENYKDIHISAYLCKKKLRKDKPEDKEVT